MDQVLFKAMGLAAARGWDWRKQALLQFAFQGNLEELAKYVVGKHYVEGVIFDHDFAECLFGLEWADKLYELVFAKDRLRFIERYLESQDPSL